MACIYLISVGQFTGTLSALTWHSNFPQLESNTRALAGTQQWKAMDVSVDLPHLQTQQCPVPVLRTDFSLELNGSIMCVPGHCRTLSGHWWTAFCGVRFLHSVSVSQSRVKHVHRSSPRKKVFSWCMWIPKFSVTLRNGPGRLFSINSEVLSRLLSFSCWMRLNSGQHF